MKKIILLGLIILVSVACTTPDIAVSDDLKTDAPAMVVKGRQGWQFNQVIKFGDYTTSKVKRGWTSKYDVAFYFRFQGAKEKLSFTQMTPDGKQAEILAVSKFRNEEVELIKGWLAAPLERTNTFAGTIIPSDSKEKVWEFILYNPEGSFDKNNTECGLIKDPNGATVVIKAVKKLEGQKSWIQIDNYGFEFWSDNKAIGAVSTINNGKVWIKNSLNPELKLVVSAVSTSILLRNSIEDKFD
ncbi:MAG: hypothetical protein WCR42_11820 [bacterium]